MVVYLNLCYLWLHNGRWRDCVLTADGATDFHRWSEFWYWKFKTRLPNQFSQVKRYQVLNTLKSYLPKQLTIFSISSIILLFCGGRWDTCWCLLIAVHSETFLIVSRVQKFLGVDCQLISVIKLSLVDLLWDASNAFLLRQVHLQLTF